MEMSVAAEYFVDGFGVVVFTSLSMMPVVFVLVCVWRVIGKFRS